MVLFYSDTWLKGLKEGLSVEHTDLDFVKTKHVLDLDVLLEHSPSMTESASEVRQGSPLRAGVQGFYPSSANNCSQITWSLCA